MPQPVFLHNTLSRKVELLEPLVPPQLGIYTCGPTVYQDPHIGNYRTYIFEDVLVKTLSLCGYQPYWVMNITDVGHLVADLDEGEDKMQVGARQESTTAWEVAKKYEQIFLKGLEALHITHPDKLVRATDTIPEQIKLIQQLEEKGYTYQLADGLYFDSSKVPDYGQLAHLDIQGLQAGARVAMQAGKRLPTDFALWKFSPADSKRDMEWESPWGRGFPGWHIECSAIALKELGEQLDLHCGAMDLIPVHHTNEIAQSEAATGKQFVRCWSHAEFLLIDGGKMSKSLHNVYTLKDLAENGIEPLAFRLFTFSAHYRSKLNFTWQGIEAAQLSLQHLRQLTPKTSEETLSPEVETYLQQFQAALRQDLNLPEGLALLWKVLKSSLSDAEKRAFVRQAEEVFSLGLLEEQKLEEIPGEVQSLVEQREQLRERKDWAGADELRLQIEKLGYTLIDTAENKTEVKKHALRA